MTDDGAVLVADLETGERRLLDGKAKGSRVSFVAGGRLLEITPPAGESFNPSYRYHDTRDWEDLGALLGSGPLLDPEQGGPRQFARPSKGGGVRLFDLDRRQALDELTGPDLQSGQLSPDGSVAILRQAHEPARIIDLAAGKALHVKFLKAKEYPGVLAYEHDLMNFLRERQEAWGLKGHYPKGIVRLGRLPAGQAPAGVSLALDRRDGWLTFMAYEVDLVQGQNPYTAYLNDPGIEPKDFLRAFMVNVHDRFAMARRGLFDQEIIELFHNKEHERRYDWMVDFRPVHHARRGAGRLNDVVGATLYPNVRLSGPADLAGLVHIDDLFLEDALPDHADGRAWRLLDINERDPDLARPSLLAALLGDTLLSLALIPPTYLERRGSLDWRTEKTRGRTLLQESLKVLFKTSFNSTDYVADLLGKKIPQELFPGSQLRYGQIESSRGWTPWGWDIMAVSHRLPIAGSPNRGSRDLGPVNGPLPLQALVRGLYIAATAMTARIGAPSSRDRASGNRPSLGARKS